MRIYLDTLFPAGIAQVPFLYGKDHSDKLNEIAKHGIRKKRDGRVYYELPDDWDINSAANHSG